MHFVRLKVRLFQEKNLGPSVLHRVGLVLLQLNWVEHKSRWSVLTLLMVFFNYPNSKVPSQSIIDTLLAKLLSISICLLISLQHMNPYQYNANVPDLIGFGKQLTQMHKINRVNYTFILLSFTRLDKFFFFFCTYL